MMRRSLITAALLAALASGPAAAEGNFVVPTPPAADNSNRAASTAFVKGAISAIVIPPAGVTSVTCGNGLSGGTITTTGTCAVGLSFFTNSIAAFVSMSNTTSYFDGPSVAQGTSGTWFASGTVSLSSSSADTIVCRLWDGTTIADTSAVSVIAGANNFMPLSGILASPAANIRISCRDTSTANGTINASADSIVKASTVSVFRLQ